MLGASWGHLKWWWEGRKGRDRQFHCLLPLSQQAVYTQRLWVGGVAMPSALGLCWPPLICQSPQLSTWKVQWTNLCFLVGIT